MATDQLGTSPRDAIPAERVTRIVKDTSLYETAVGLYPVLLALILTDSLKNMAIDIVNHPLSGNWSERFLTCALLVLSAVWLHVWIATFRMTKVTGVASQRAEHAGLQMKGVDGYALAIGLFWLGIIQLVLFACMAYSVTREKEFFLESAIYSAIIFAYSSTGINESKDHVWKRPWRAVTDLWKGRHLPLSKEDLNQYVEASSTDQKNLASQGSVYDTAMGLVLVVLSLGLYLIVLNFGSSSWTALVALIGVVTAVVMDYYVYPYFYLL